MRQHNTAQLDRQDARKTSVMVVENDPAIRDMLRMMLDLEGYAVQVVSGGMEALSELRKQREPRVVLVNHLLPDIDGQRVLATAATSPTLWRHRYVLMSTCATCDTHRELTRHAALLHKPFSVEQLLEVVEDAASHLSMAQSAMQPPARQATPHAVVPILSAGTRIALVAATAAIALTSFEAVVAGIRSIRSIRSRHPLRRG